MSQRKGYLPNEVSFLSGLPEGKSRYEPQSHIGRTRRERDKQAKRSQRIRDRSEKAAREMNSGTRKN